MSAYIVGCGAALPERVISNEEIAPMLGVTPEWIVANSGIQERRWATHETCADLAIAAAQNALAQAQCEASNIDYVLAGTLSPDFAIPGIAPLVQRKLTGNHFIPALDIRVGCAAILYSLQISCGLIAAQVAKTIVCIGAEAQAKGLDLNARSAEISMLFGDGAGAFVIRNQPSEKFCLRVLDVLIATDGNFAEDLCVKALPIMNGRTVILHAVRKLSAAAQELLRRNNLSMADIDLVIPHQANLNLLRTLSKQLAFDESKMVINVNRYGNTSGASAFIALAEVQQMRCIPPHANILVLAFGAGFTWGAALLKSC